MSTDGSNDSSPDIFKEVRARKNLRVPKKRNASKRCAASSPVHHKRSKRKLYLIMKKKGAKLLKQEQEQEQEEQAPEQQPFEQQALPEAELNVFIDPNKLTNSNSSNKSTESAEITRKVQDMFKKPELSKFYKQPAPKSLQYKKVLLPVPDPFPSDTPEPQPKFYISYGSFKPRQMRVINNYTTVPRRYLMFHQKHRREQRSLPQLPAGVEDFDHMHWHDPLLMGHYAKDIFSYLKSRETDFIIVDYMPQQVNLTSWMRTLLVDWMLEVQEIFELSHDTLYLAIKVVDLYLCRKVIKKEQLQLLGAAAYFMACKYDDRQAPLIKDILYVCDGAYNRNELIKMELDTLCTIKFELGIPLAYRFMCRYARCAKIQLSVVTLARFVLEMGLLYYVTITYSDSKMAAAALYIALRMTAEDDATTPEETWSSTLIYYSGYELAEFATLVTQLNACLRLKPLPGINCKYAEKLYFEMDNIPVLSNAQLLPQ